MIVTNYVFTTKMLTNLGIYIFVETLLEEAKQEDDIVCWDIYFASMYINANV